MVVRVASMHDDGRRSKGRIQQDDLARGFRLVPRLVFDYVFEPEGCVDAALGLGKGKNLLEGRVQLVV